MNSYAIIALIVGVALLLAGLFFGLGFVRYRRTRGWTPTTGIVVKRKTGATSGMPSRWPTFRWVDDNGREHQHTSNWHQSFPPRPGTQVAIRYNPDAPNRAVIDSFAQNGSVFVLVGAVIALVAVLGGGFAAFMVSALSEIWAGN